MGVLVLALALVVVLWLSWSALGGGSGGTGGISETGGSGPDPEFARVAERLRDGDNEILGHGPIARLRLAQESTRPGTVARYDVDVELASHLLRVGRVDDAIALLDGALEQARATPALAPSIPQLQRWRGMAWLRKAEVENCVRRHDAACCIFPLQGSGVHADPAPAAAAARAYEAVLEARPDDAAMRWLANVAYMAQGLWPDGVPEPLRIPAATFATDPAHEVPRFVNLAPALGVDALNLCGGAIAEDFDGDGFLDVVTSSFDPAEPLRFYRNRGDGTFEDRSVRSGLARQLGGLNCIAADHDDDGDVDVLVLRGAWLYDDGRIRNSLLQNDGDGNFTDVTRRAGLALPAYPTQAAAWADFDLDGDLDLFVGNESRIELGERPGRGDRRGGGGDFPSQLFRNDGDGTFTDVARAAGVTNDRYCKGCAVGDYDNDGDPDLYVSNVGHDRLYRNDGALRFEDVAAELGVTGPEGRSFAAWFFDFDHDGWLDLFVAPYRATLADVCDAYLGRPHRGEVPRLYRNEGGAFRDVAADVGLDFPCLPMGANFGDVDGDGWLDVYLATGEPSYEMLVPNLLFRNDGGKRFVDVTTAAGLGHLQKGHGVAFADFDHDGDQDLYHQLGGFYPGDAYPNALFVNPGAGPAGGGSTAPPRRFLTIELRGRVSNRFGLGARIRVDVDTPRGPRSLHRAVGSVSSFGGSPFRQEIGLGDATAVRLVSVWWPATRTDQVVRDVPVDAFVRIAEGKDGFETLSRPRFQFRTR